MTHQAKSKYVAVVLLLIVLASFSTFVEGLDRGNLLKVLKFEPLEERA